MNKVVTVQTLEVDSTRKNPSKGSFYAILLIAEIFAVVSIILLGVWTGKYEGAKWVKDVVGSHAIFMIIGFVYLNGHAAILFRIFPGVRRQTMQMVHGGILVVALVLIILGLITSDYAETMGDTRTYHSWLGIMAVVLFCTQLLFGVIGFVLPIPANWRMVYRRIHIVFGSITFIVAMLATLTGINEESASKILDMISENVANNVTKHGGDSLTPEIYIINFLGFFLTMFAGTIFYLLLTDSYRRIPTGKDSA